MTQTPEEWQLFIDESGDQTATDPRTTVVGVALQEPDSREYRQILRQRIEAALPMVPWPPHTVLLHPPFSWPVFRRLGRASSDDRGRQWAAICDQALDVMDRAVEDPPLDVLRRKLMARIFPTYDDIQRASERLRQIDMNLWNGLRQMGEQASHAVQTIIADLQQTFGPDRFMLIVSGPSWGADEPPDTTERYAALLGALLERTDPLLRRPGVRQVVRVHIAQRHFHADSLSRAIPLTAPGLGQIIAAARQNTIGQRETVIPLIPEFRFITGGVWDANHDPNTPAGLFLADWMSNRIGRILRARPTIRRFDDQARQLVSVSLQRHLSSLPEWEPIHTTAADGPARTVVLDAFAGAGTDGVPVDVPDIRPLWAAEQAAEWRQVAAAFSATTDSGGRS